MYTTHGHQIEGTPVEGAPKLRARCGGPGLCTQCTFDAQRFTKPNPATSTSTTGPYMEMTTFVRKPFTVQAVEVTEENIGMIAEFVGALREKEDGTKYIQVDRRLVPNIYRVYPGFWMTKMGDNIRCYSSRIFAEQFTAQTPEIQTWVDFMNSQGRTARHNDFERN